MLAFSNATTTISNESRNSHFFLGSSTEIFQKSNMVPQDFDSKTNSTATNLPRAGSGMQQAKRYKVSRKKPVYEKKSVASCGSNWIEDAHDLNDCNDRFKLLEMINCKRNNTARKETARLDAVFERLADVFDLVSRIPKATSNLDTVEMQSFINEQRGLVEINAVAEVERFLKEGPAKLATSKKIKKEPKGSRKCSAPENNRKVSFSTHFTSQCSSVTHPSSPIPMDMYANYDKKTSLFSSRVTMESPILYNAELDEDEKKFADDDDKISFFNFSNDSTRSETREELESYDFIFCKGNDDEPSYDQAREARQENCGAVKNELKADAHDCHAQMKFEEEKHMSWIKQATPVEIEGVDFSVGCMDQEFSVVPNCTTENSVEGDEFEATLSCFDHLL